MMFGISIFTHIVGVGGRRGVKHGVSGGSTWGQSGCAEVGESEFWRVKRMPFLS